MREYTDGQKMEILRHKIKDPSYQFLNRLFFQARDLAIEAVLNKIKLEIMEDYKFKHKVEVDFDSSSFSLPSIVVRFYNRKSQGWEYTTCKMILEKDSVAHNALELGISTVFLKFRNISRGEYWPRKIPNDVVEFWKYFEDKYANGYGEELVNRLNYPFDKKSYFPF